MRRLLVFAFLLASLTTRADDNVLVYVYQADCGACIKFNQEVAGVYPKTREAAWLPMVKVSFEDWRAGNHPYRECATDEVFATPTFVHISACREVDRITGYSSDELFWLAVARMHNRAPAN